MRDIDAIWEVSHAGERSTCLKRIQWVSKNAFSGKTWFWAVSDGSWWIYVAICSDLWTRSRPSFRADFRKGQTHRWNVCSALQCNFHRPWHLALRTFAGMWRIVEGAWDMHGICMGYAWDMHGICILDHFGSWPSSNAGWCLQLGLQQGAGRVWCVSCLLYPGQAGCRRHLRWKDSQIEGTSRNVKIR